MAWVKVNIKITTHLIRVIYMYIHDVYLDCHISLQTVWVCVCILTVLWTIHTVSCKLCVHSTSLVPRL